MRGLLPDLDRPYVRGGPSFIFAVVDDFGVLTPVRWPDLEESNTVDLLRAEGFRIDHVYLDKEPTC